LPREVDFLSGYYSFVFLETHLRGTECNLPDYALLEIRQQPEGINLLSPLISQT